MFDCLKYASPKKARPDKDCGLAFFCDIFSSHDANLYQVQEGFLLLLNQDSLNLDQRVTYRCIFSNLRRRQKSQFKGTFCISQGVPYDPQLCNDCVTAFTHKVSNN